MPKGHPIAVRNVPWHITIAAGPNGEDTHLLKPASTPGYWNLWPLSGGNAVRTMIPAHEAARIWPQHADRINNRRDSSD